MSELRGLLVKGGMNEVDSKVVSILVEAGVTLKDAIDLKESIKSTLKVYGATRVWFENGRYEQTPHSVLKANYNNDHQYVTTILDTDIYTEEQLKANLAELSKANWLD